MPPSSNRSCSRTGSCSRPSWEEVLVKAAQNGVEELNVNGTRLSNLAGGSGTVEVTILQLVTPALTRCTAMLNVSTIDIDFVRIKIQKQSASVIGMLTEFATNELEGSRGYESVLVSI